MIAAALLLAALSAAPMPEGAWECLWREGAGVARVRLTVDPDGSFLVQARNGLLLTAGRAEARGRGQWFFDAGAERYSGSRLLRLALHLHLEGARLTDAAGEGRFTCRRLPE